jgi:hypothetical protein
MTKFVDGFNPRNMTALGEAGGNVVTAYVSDFKGETYVNIRQIYKDKNGDWAPGKGIAIKKDDWPEFISKVNDFNDVCVGTVV